MQPTVLPLLWLYLGLCQCNSALAKSARAAYKEEEERNSLGVQLYQSHEICEKNYKEFLSKQAEIYMKFSQMFVKFDQYHARLKERDEALQAFYHYSRKMEKLKTDREFMLKKGYTDQ